MIYSINLNQHQNLLNLVSYKLQSTSIWCSYVSFFPCFGEYLAKFDGLSSREGMCSFAHYNCVNVPSFYLSWFLMFQMLILMIQSKRKQRMKWSVHKTKWHLKRIFQLNILTRVFLPFFPLFLAGFTFTDM